MFGIEVTVPSMIRSGRFVNPFVLIPNVVTSVSPSVMLNDVLGNP